MSEIIKPIMTDETGKAIIEAIIGASDQKQKIDAISTKTQDLQNQINNIVSPVTQDAELQNLRIGVDGKSYPTAKARVDAEITDVKENLKNIESSILSSADLPFVRFEKGSYAFHEGQLPEKNNSESYLNIRQRSDKEYLFDNEFSVSISTGNTLYVCLINSDGTCGATTTINGSTRTFEAGRYCFMFKNNADNVISSDNVYSNTTGLTKETQISKNKTEIKRLSDTVEENITVMSDKISQLDVIVKTGEAIRLVEFEKGSYSFRENELPKKNDSESLKNIRQRSVKEFYFSNEFEINVSPGNTFYVCPIKEDGTCGATRTINGGARIIESGNYCFMFKNNDDNIITADDVFNNVEGLTSKTQIGKNKEAIEKTSNEVKAEISSIEDSLNSGIKMIKINWLNGTVHNIREGEKVEYASGYDNVRKYVFIDFTSDTKLNVSNGYTVTIIKVTAENICLPYDDKGNMSKVVNGASYILPAGRYVMVFKDNGEADISTLDVNTTAVFGNEISFGGLKEQVDRLYSPKYQFAIDNILCIGDSLTEGAYFGNDWNDKPEGSIKISQNYPYYLSRMLSCKVTNGGASGYTAKEWFDNQISQFELDEYNTFIIWLGTNEGLTDTLQTDVIAHKSAGEDYNSFADTNTGCYCKIIEKIKAENSNPFIVLLTIFAGSAHNPDDDNNVIKQISELYNLPIIDMSDLTVDNYPVLHGNVKNVHFTKAGNLFISSRIINEINAIFNSNPKLTEFGFSKGERNSTYEH